MGQSASVWVCGHSRGRIYRSIFTKIGTDIRTPKRKNEFVKGQYRTTPSPILPTKTPILGQEVLKTHVSNPISASLNVRESPKFPRLIRNRGRGTRWWRQILDKKCKYGRFAHVQWKICNIQGRSDGGGISGYIPPQISPPKIFMGYFFFIWVRALTVCS